MDAANVDLKGFTEEFYREYCGGHLQPVLDTLRWLVHDSSDVGGDHQPDYSRGERLAGRHSADVPVDRRANWGPTCRCTFRRFIPTSS